MLRVTGVLARPAFPNACKSPYAWWLIMRALALLSFTTLAVLSSVAPAAGQERSPVQVTGVNEDLAAAISATLVARAAPQSLFQAERLSVEAAERAGLFLRSEGYYQAVVTADPLEDPFVARIVVEAGPQFKFARPSLVYEDGTPADDAKAAVDAALKGLAEGAPARAGDVLAAEAAALKALQDSGYADAALLPRRAVVDHATQTMAVTLALHAGPQVRLGSVRVEQAATLSAEMAERFAPFERGDLFSPDALTELRRGVAGSGAFSSVQTRLAEAQNADGSRDVVLSAQPEERRSIDLGLSWSIGEGAGAEAIWTRRNMWRRAETVTFEIGLAEQRQSIGAGASLPRAGPQGQTARINASIAREDEGPYNRDALEASIAFDAEAIGRFRPSYGASIAADTYSETAGVGNAIVLASFVETRLDATDSVLDARHGYDLRLRAEPSVSFGDGSTGFLRVTGDARVFHTAEGRSWLTLAARTRVGWIEPIAGSDDDLPTDRLFYAGGGGSVRGYAYNAIFADARQRAGLSPGGRGLIEVSGEARTRLSERWGVVAFVDGGNAFDELGDAGDLRFGAGIGVRYDLGFAPLRIDLAAPLDPRDTDDPVAVYISIGQAF